MIKFIQHLWVATFIVLFTGLTNDTLSAQQGAVISTMEEDSYQITQADLSEMFYKVDFEDQISLYIRNGTIKDALQQVASQTGLILTYRGDLQNDKRITMNVSGISVSNALAAILRDTNLDYSFSRDGYLLVRPESTETQGVQEVVVSGQVTDASTGETLPAVNVVVRGTTIGTSTDADGNYELAVPSLSDTLLYSFIGYTTLEVPIDGRSNIDVELNPSAIMGEELIVTGYSAQTRSDLTGSVAVLDTDNLRRINSEQVTKQLQGLAAGVTVTSSGEVGAEAQVRIRGLNTFGNNTPLYIVDGVPTQDISDLNANDIEQMQVLKDASAASIYGARASNGVIIIETAQGQQGSISINYDVRYNYSVPNQGNVYNLANPQELADIYCQARLNDGVTIPHDQFGDCTNPTVPDFIDPAGSSASAVDISSHFIEAEFTDPSALNTFTFITPAAQGEGTNWFDEVYQPVGSMVHNLSVSGGGDIGSYLFSLNYTDAKGTNWINAGEGPNPAVETGNRLTRYILRANSTFDVNENVRIGENISYSVSDNPGGGTPGSVRETPSIIPVYDVGGYFAGGHASGFGRGNNPVAGIYRDRNNVELNKRLFGNIFGEFDFMEDMFTFRTSLGGELSNGKSTSINYPEYETAEPNTNNGYSIDTDEEFEMTWTNTLQFAQDFGASHSVEALIGSEYYKAEDESFNGSNTDYYTLDPDFVTLSTGTGTQEVESFRSEEALLSYFGKVNYSYDNRYLVSGTIRRDGSSKFINHRWGWFPSFSLGWRVTQENFFPDVPWLDDLKIRAGWGILGNQLNVDRYNGYTTYESDPEDSGYPITGTNNGSTAGFQQARFGAPDARWEKNITTNIGFDAILLNGSLEFSVEYYKKSIEDLLYDPELPGTAGSADQPFINVASMENTGLDASLMATGTIESIDLQYNTQLTFTAYKNEIVGIAPGIDNFEEQSSRFDQANIVRNQVGEPVSSFWGYDVIGFWNEQSEIDAADASAPSGIYQEGVRPGMFRYRDVNGDGEITVDDRTKLGNPNPDFTYGLNLGLNYRNFDVSAFFYGVQGNEVFQEWRWWTDFVAGFVGSKSKRALYDSWRPDNQDAKVSVLSDESTISANSSPNSYFVDDGSYFRMKNLQVGYTLPVELTQRIGISNARIFVQGTNLFTITRYSGPEPEIGSFGGGDTAFGIDDTSYPLPREFSIGIHISY